MTKILRSCVSRLAHAYYQATRPFSNLGRRVDARLGLSRKRAVKAIGDRANTVHSPRLLLEAIRHYGEPVIQNGILGRLVGYGETAVDCYFLVELRDRGLIWATCVGGTTFLDALKRQNRSIERSGAVWSDFSRLQTCPERNAPRDLAQFQLELEHNNTENGEHVKAAAPGTPEPLADSSTPLGILIAGLSYDSWMTLNEKAQLIARRDACLTDQLRGLLGKTVEVVPAGDRFDRDNHGPRRFVVGQSNGFAPISLELAEHGAEFGRRASMRYETVTVLD